MIKLKKLIKEWTDESFKTLPKRWSKPVMTNEKDGLTEFERQGAKDNVSLDEAMSDEKRAFLMLGIWGRSWQVNLNNVLKGINKDKPGVIKKGLKELKILHKKIEEEIEQIV
tara:strand:- start:224 stop:559 length:336 start_codon:yes stop_codon:yes gene_type:complete